MNLKSLLISSDEKTVRILRRVLNDLEIIVEHCPSMDDGIRRLTRHRFEAIIVDCEDPAQAANVLKAAKAAPVNKRALSIALVESAVGMKTGFDMGALFVLHKPLAAERARGSFRAVRALMKRERRLQLRVPVQVPVVCVGSARFQAKTLDLCEGGMALQFTGRPARESTLRFELQLPGLSGKLEIWGEMAWEGNASQAGVRFQNVSEEQRKTLRGWLNTQLPEPEPDDPPVACRVSEISFGACYLTTNSPFPKSTRVVLVHGKDKDENRAAAVVRVSHAEFGMGIEFLQTTPEQKKEARGFVDAVRLSGETPEVLVEPDGLETGTGEATLSSNPSLSDDTLLGLFREQPHAPPEVFMELMNLQRQLQQPR